VIGEGTFCPLTLKKMAAGEMSLFQGKQSGSLKAGVHPFGTTAVEAASLLSNLLDVGIFVDLVVPLPAKVRPWNGVDE
jgi:hypothetical protein